MRVIFPQKFTMWTCDGSFTVADSIENARSGDGDTFMLFKTWCESCRDSTCDDTNDVSRCVLDGAGYDQSHRNSELKLVMKLVEVGVALEIQSLSLLRR